MWSHTSNTFLLSLILLSRLTVLAGRPGQRLDPIFAAVGEPLAAKWQLQYTACKLIVCIATVFPLLAYLFSEPDNSYSFTEEKLQSWYFLLGRLSWNEPPDIPLPAGDYSLNEDAASHCLDQPVSAMKSYP